MVVTAQLSRPRIQRRVNRMRRVDLNPYFVRIVTTQPGGTTTEKDTGFASRESAIEACDQLQREIDEDCEARRVYVLDVDKVPIAAGSERRGNRSASHRREREQQFNAR
jgi:hypothetical protein